MWEQWAGIVQHGRPEALILRKLQPKITVKRAPGPGAIRKTEWKLIAKELLLDRKVILYTDSAKSYKLKLSGVLHDKVVHCKKRVKVKGKWQCTCSNPQAAGYIRQNPEGQVWYPGN